ncbi:long-chain fatty acid--CoA ligase [Sulfurifustis variabilis]|uniref:Long-chain fatty acid--CoA ligase n=1 Tax=Sulfurifustis variabilis TaxID=1675686 RepID=A0A1B4V5N7_9GAMM|nr:iron-containing redox enzyme family protein [Sulfurifustis variabilis]BAU48745.1 long-chain fatty acid--CoA ligase [Sulfurifustis variabilis]
MSFYDELHAATEPARREFLAIPFLQDGVAGRLPLPGYIAFLTEAYHHVKHTLPLLMACGSRLPERLEWLRTAVAEYIEEETGHQEWILNDIRACGGDAEAVRRGRPSLATELMVAYAYDTVQRGNPAGLFGMVFVLEGTSVSLATRAGEALQAALGLPKQAFSYLLSHGSLDLEHIEFFRGLVNRLDREEDRAAIVHCANVVYRLYGDMFRSLPRESRSLDERRYA